MNYIPSNEYITDSEAFIILLPRESDTSEEIELAKFLLYADYSNQLIKSDHSVLKVTILVDKEDFFYANKAVEEFEELFEASEFKLNLNRLVIRITDPEIRNNLGLNPENITFFSNQYVTRYFIDTDWGDNTDWGDLTDEEKIMRGLENGQGEYYGY